MQFRFNFGRLISRIALIVAFSVAVAMPVIAFVYRGPSEPETWTVSAAALAVITSIIAAWSSRRVVELQEDAQSPSIYPAFDFTGRYGLTILKVKNTGGTPAHNISLEWDIDLKNNKGETIGFHRQENSPAISVLLPGESISQTIAAHHEFISNHPDAEYTGVTTYQDTNLRKFRQHFRLDGRPYSGTPSYDEEAPRTHYELQKIPKQLEEIKKVLQSLLPKAGK